MSILNYFRPSGDSLPEPNGSLSRDLPPHVIRDVNEAVRAEAEKEKTKHRGPYNKYSPKLRATIGKRASIYSIASTSRYYSKKFGTEVGESTIRSIKKDYVRCLEEARRSAPPSSIIAITTLPTRRRGRPLLLNDLDGKVQVYIEKVRSKGGSISSRTAIVVARALLMKYDRSSLEEFGGPVSLKMSWAHSLFKRMNYVQRKATTSQPKLSGQDFDKLKEDFLNDIATTVLMEEIPAELIMNFDQTGIKIVPSATWTMEQQGSKCVTMTGLNDKRQITLVVCGTLIGDVLPFQVIYKGKTDRCHPKYNFPLDWNITHSPKHWSTEETSKEYVVEVLVPYVNRMRETVGNSPALVIMDNFKGQVTPGVLKLLQDNDIHVCRLPPNTTDRLQPMDVSVNKPIKQFLRNKFEDWFTQKIVSQLEGHDINDIDKLDIIPTDLSMRTLKHIGAEWLVETFEYIQQNPQFVVNGFVRSGILAALDKASDDKYVDGECSDNDHSENECSDGEFSDDECSDGHSDADDDDIITI